MSKITLKPLDDGQKSVEIPVGKTTIGRGPFLGCSDKKVSRNHAVLEVTADGEVFLTPTHVNPCFFQPTADSPGTILKKDKPHKLENGDSFSLLPRAFRYQLVVTSSNDLDNKVEEKIGLTAEEKTNGSAEEKHEKENNVDECSKTELNKEETNNNVPPVFEQDNHEKSPEPIQEVVRKEPEEEATKQMPSDEAKKPEVEVNGTSAQEFLSEHSVPKENEEKVVEEHPEPEPEKETEKESSEANEKSGPRTTRTLPQWLVELSSPAKEERKVYKSSKRKYKDEVPVKRKEVSETKIRKKRNIQQRSGSDEDVQEEHSQQRRASGRSPRTNRQTRQGLSLEDFIASDDDDWQSDKSEPRHKKRKGRRRDDDSGSDWETEHKKSKKTTHKYGSESESGSDWGSSSQKKKKTPRGRPRRSKRVTAESEDEMDDKLNSTKPDKRVPCTYGKKCFRKNSSHLEQYIHPGDSDYESEQEASQKSFGDNEDESDGDTNKKKECPYGTTCYRKNPQHKKEFKHTKKVRPQREAAKQAGKKTKGSKDNEEPDVYDLNDSYINDDSDEYKPVDSGSEYDSSQETKRPLKAAKMATKTKKPKRV